MSKQSNNSRRWLIVGVVSSIVSAGAYLFQREQRSNNASGGGAISSGPRTAETIRADVARIARENLGKRELTRYFSTACPDCTGDPEWCGIFALWALQQAGLATGWTWVVSRGFLFRLPTTKTPQLGDLAYFNANQHHAVVVGVRGDTVDVINGNGQNGVVSASSPPKSKAAAYYSIDPLIAEVLRATP